jgi:hypothetical protein
MPCSRRLTFSAPLGDVFQNLGHLPERPAGVADFHRPCFAHMARTSWSVANSPRSASARERLCQLLLRA